MNGSGARRLGADLATLAAEFASSASRARTQDGREQRLREAAQIRMVASLEGEDAYVELARAWLRAGARMLAAHDKADEAYDHVHASMGAGACEAASFIAGGML